MKQSIIIILAVLIIVVGGAVYFSKKQASDNGVLRQVEDITEAGVAVSPYDLNASGCVGDEGDLAMLKEKCPAQGGTCSVMGESDPIQVALKFADAEKLYPCK